LTAYYPQTDRQTERINQELEQYLRVFIDYRQEQWPDWLGMAEFAYNNKIHVATKISPFKANYGQDPRMGFKGRRKGKYKAVGKFVERIKKNPEGSKSSTRKSIEENEEVCKQKTKGGKGIQSRGLSTAKYEGLEMADKRKKIGEANRTFCGPLQSQGNRL